jgi:glycosyltransferase involved in cell wall biosynthesis
LALALTAAGYDVKHFCAKYEPWQIGHVDATCPIRSEVLEFDTNEWKIARIQDRYRRAVDAWLPDFVVVTDSWSFKPYLAEAVEKFPYLLRFDALECLCPLNNLRQLPHSPKEIRTCPRHRLATPEVCVTCVNQLGHRSSPLHQSERPLSEFSTDAYHALLLRVLERSEAVLVFNPLIGTLLEPYARCVRVIPAGVQATRYALPKSNGAAEKQPYHSILFAGRVADPVKGFHVLYDAAMQLWRDRQDFRIVVTGEPAGSEAPFLDFRGWTPHGELPALLSECDLLVAPATAPEPFGITAIEAMAAALPVVASRIGGLQFTVLDEVTGLLFEPGSSEDLAAQLSRLLDHPARARQLGNAGRLRVLEQFDWKAIIRRHYAPLFQRRSVPHAQLSSW